GREHADRALRHLVLVVHEHSAELLEPADDVVVVHDVVTDVDRWAVLVEELLDDLDRAVDAGAEGAWRGEQDAAAHAVALSSAFNARRTSPSARTVPAGSRTSAFARPSSRGRPPGVTASASPPSGRSAVSLIARTQPASRPVAASTPLSMSTAS